MACANSAFNIAVMMGNIGCLRACITLMIKDTRVFVLFLSPMHAILPFTSLLYRHLIKH